MNERIRTLLIQAQDLARSEVENNPDIKPPYHIPATQVHVGLGLSYEKFAELIVRECNQAVLEVPLYYKDYRSQIEEAVIRDCARAVLEKFGVEQ